MNRTTLNNVKGSGQNSPAGSSKLKNQVRQPKNSKNPVPNNNPTPSTSLNKRQVPSTTKQKSQPLKRNPESQPNANNSNKKNLNKNSTKGGPQVLPANTNNTSKKSATPSNPAASKTNVNPQSQPKPAPQQPSSGTKNATNAGAASKKGAAPSNPSAPQTNNPKTDTRPSPQPIGETKRLTLEQPKTPGQPSIEQVNQTEDATKFIQTNQIKLIKGSLDKVLNNWELIDAALRLAYGSDYYIKLNKDYDKLRQDRLGLKVEKYKRSLADSAKTAVSLSAGESSKEPNSQEQVKALLKKNKIDLMNIEDSRCNISTIAFFSELAPQIVYAARSDTLDATFIKGICEQIQQMVQKTSPRIYLDSLDMLRIRHTVHGNFPERSLESLQEEQIKQLLQGYPQMSLDSLDMLEISFRRLLDPQVLQAFRDHINDYLQQIQDAQGDEALQNRIEERLQAFVYNFLVPPYQNDNEGSCFATAFLMNMWYNSPIDYMRFIRWAIDTDEPFDLTKIGGRGIIDLRALRKGDPRIAIKRVLLAIIAPMYESAFKNERTHELRKRTSEITKKTLNGKNEVARALINACITLNPGTSYVNGEWIPTFLLKTYTEKTSDVFNRGISIIQDAAPDISPDVAREMLICIFTEVRQRVGGRPKGIIQKWMEGQRFEEKTITFKKPIENGIFTEEQIKPLFDFLKSGEKEKFAIISLNYQNKEGKPDGSHTCNIIMKNYEDMKQGDIWKFMNLNYLDSIHSSSWVWLEKTANGYQLKWNGAPFPLIVSFMKAYPTFEAKIMQHPV